MSTIALLLAALGGGAVAGAIATCFIWLVETVTESVWVDLPDRIGVDPYGSWWLFAIPIAGGVLVGLGQRFLGNYPEPIERNIARWRAGGHVDPRTVPASTVNALIALAAGGPVGFEAALTGLVGGIATWVGTRVRRVGRLVRQAWGAERIDALPRAMWTLPSWLSALAGLVTYRWMPFGQIDFSFRFDPLVGDLGISEGLTVFGFAATVAVPAAWASTIVARAENATLFRRSPVAVAMVGGALIALLAAGNDLVLFSGQQGIDRLEDTGTGELLYLAVAKWAGLVIALLAGWRGGPIFPLFFSVSALAAAVDAGFDVGANLVMAGGIAAVSVVLAKGRVPMAFLLALYVVPMSYAAVVLIGIAGAASALAIAGSLHGIPAQAERSLAEPAPEATSATG